MAATIETKEKNAWRLSIVIYNRIQKGCKRAVACRKVWQMAATIETKEKEYAAPIDCHV